MKEIYLQTDNLSAGYNRKAVVRGIRFPVRSGEILSLVGPNGAGKSTILRAVIRQLKPLCGTVYLRGQDMASISAGETARSLSLVLTDRIDGELLTAEDVVLSGRYPYTGRLGILSPRDRAAADAAMEQIGMTELRDRFFRQLSDGQRQRVLLARALCQEPDVLVMDEPTSFLDIRYQLELFTLLRTLVERRGLAVLLSLHELEFARRVSDYILCVRDGTAERYGPPEILTDACIEALYGLPEGSYSAFFRGGVQS